MEMNEGESNSQSNFSFSFKCIFYFKFLLPNGNRWYFSHNSFHYRHIQNFYVVVNTVLQINYSCLNNVSFNGSKYVILYENGIICKTFIFQPANFLYSIIVSRLKLFYIESYFLNLLVKLFSTFILTLLCIYEHLKINSHYLKNNKSK